MDTSEGQILDMLDKGCKRWICQEGAKRKTIKIPGCSQGGHGAGGCNSRGSKTWQQKNHVANTSLMLFFIVFFYFHRFSECFELLYHSPLTIGNPVFLQKESF